VLSGNDCVLSGSVGCYQVVCVLSGNVGCYQVVFWVVRLCFVLSCRVVCC